MFRTLPGFTLHFIGWPLLQNSRGKLSLIRNQAVSMYGSEFYVCLSTIFPFYVSVPEVRLLKQVSLHVGHLNNPKP